MSYFWTFLVVVVCIPPSHGFLKNLCLNLCGWSDWGQWSHCSRTCGGGTRSRSRSLCAWMWLNFDQKLNYCKKSPSEARDQESCAQMCYKGTWSGWRSSCRCNQGYKGICCNEKKAFWSLWNSWSQCSETCGSGVQRRQRLCMNSGPEGSGNECQGPDYMARGCSLTPTCPRLTRAPTTTSRPTTATTPTPTTITPAPFRFRKQLSNTSIPAGELVILECSTDPMTDVTWYFEDAPLISRSSSYTILPNGVLIILSLDAETVGKYSCSAEKNNEILTSTAWITSPDLTVCSIEFSNPPANGTQPVGALHTIPCLTSPAGKVTWFKNNQSLLSDGRVLILSNGFLLLRSLVLNDTGTYTCHVIQEDTGCTLQASAVLTVYDNISQVCGQPVRAEPFDVSEQRGHIVGGRDAAFGSAPWNAMLWEKNIKNFCGGVLLNEQWVATAAHCFYEFREEFKRSLNRNNLVVKLGKYDRLSKKEPQEIIASIDTYYIHEQFDSESYDFDIAVIKLESRVTFTDHVRPVCWSTVDMLQPILDGDKSAFGTVTGWGMLSDGGRYPRFLNEIRLPLPSHDDCMIAMDADVTENMLCAGYEREVIGDACIGDSGGPLTMRNGTRWYVIGLVSWGEGCAKEGKYGVYSNFPKLRDWVALTIARAKNQG